MSLEQHGRGFSHGVHLSLCRMDTSRAVTANEIVSRPACSVITQRVENKVSRAGSPSLAFTDITVLVELCSGGGVDRDAMAALCDATRATPSNRLQGLLQPLAGG